jgi:hypothetical protein
MADISSSLATYLASVRARRWKPGSLDCGVFMADWIAERFQIDPIADVRGTYATERQFLRILRREGGFISSCEARLACAGFVETAFLSSGDIAVVAAPFDIRRGQIQRRPTGAIVVDRTMRAVITSDMGVVIAGGVNLPLLKAWTHRG